MLVQETAVAGRSILNSFIGVMDNPGAGLRLVIACCRASTAKWAASDRSNAQPTTVREKASRRVARKTNSCCKRTKVISASHS